MSAGTAACLGCPASILLIFLAVWFNSRHANPAMIKPVRYRLHFTCLDCGVEGLSSYDVEIPQDPFTVADAQQAFGDRIELATGYTHVQVIDVTLSKGGGQGVPLR